MNLGYKNLEKLLLEREINEFCYVRQIGSNIELISENSVWPNGFYFFQDKLNVYNKTSEKIIPESDLVFILESELDKFGLKELGFRPVDIWYSMFYKINEAKNAPTTLIFELKSDSGNNNLLNWKNKSEMVFFNGDELSQNLINSFLKSEKFELVYFFRDEKIIGQALLYFNKNEAGLYFFTIYEWHRKNGFGYDALTSICDFIYKKGYKKLLLQSTRQGKSLYQRFGFQLEEKIYIFKKNQT
jgi:hypothetical protein